MAAKSRRSKHSKSISKNGSVKAAEKRKNVTSQTSSVANSRVELQKAAESIDIHVPREVPSPARITVLKLARLTRKNLRKRRKKMAKKHRKIIKNFNDAKRRKESFQQQSKYFERNYC